MEPRIQYATTSNGVNIAYWQMGDGPPVIHLPPAVWGHLQLERSHPRWRTWHDALAERMSLIRFDLPGTGLSDGEVADFSLPRLSEFVDAVANHLQLERFGLLSPLDSGPLGVAYAAEHDDRVSHLVLYSTFAASADSSKGTGSFKGARRLLQDNWQIYVRTSSSVGFGWGSEEAMWWADFMVEAISHENYQRYFNDRRDWDTTGLLEQIRTPTLVIQRRQVKVPGVAVARGLAARIPNANLAVLEGDRPAPYDGDMETLVATVCDFMTGDAAVPANGESSAASSFRTVLFTDVEGSTALTERLGDSKARELLREHESITREALNEHGGSEVKTMGDGFMASFSSATGALECAIALQRAFAERNSSLRSQGSPSTGSGRAEEMRIRIGLNAGEPISEDDPGGRGDLFGTAVNMAARIAAKAEGGEILASNVVRELVAGKGFLFNDRGETELRGFEDPVRMYEVRWRVSE